MTSQDRVPLTHYTLQVWSERHDAEAAEWRGKIHHLASGEARYFQGWEALLTFLETTLLPGGSTAAAPNWPTEE